MAVIKKLLAVIKKLLSECAVVQADLSSAG